MIRSYLFIPIVLLTFLLYYGSSVVYGIIIRDFRKAVSIFAKLWAKHLLLLSGITVDVHNSEQIPDENNIIFAANHQSMIDILICMAYIPHHIGFLAKKSLFKIPIFGKALSSMGCLPVDRGNARKDLSMLKDAADHINNGHGVIIYPEGTRSGSQKLGKFKRGCLVLASESNATIIPTGIKGSYKTLTKGSIKVKPAHIDIYFGKPFKMSSSPSREEYSEKLGFLKEEISRLITSHD